MQNVKNLTVCTDCAVSLNTGTFLHLDGPERLIEVLDGFEKLAKGGVLGCLPADGPELIGYSKEHGCECCHTTVNGALYRMPYFPN